MSDLAHRARKILFAAVTEFIATGDAVGSRTLARKYGLDLSAASIRNVLADLEESGYLRQPHTSAGRIPTDQALRLFIDTLMEIRAVSPEQRARMGERFAAIYATSADPLRESGRLLSELSGAAAVIAPRCELRTLAQLRFIPTRPGQILAVVVFSDGSVENRFITIDGPIAEPELTRIHNLLADVIEGRTLGEIRDLLARRLLDDRTAVDTLRRRAFELGQKAMVEPARPIDVVIEGQGRLMDMPEYADVDRLRNLVRVIEERQQLVGLLDKTLAASGVTVFVGSETGELGAGELSLVVAPYAENGRIAGTIGVMGPTRMDYARVMPLVGATAAAMSEALTKR
jgi:heat-inducible transcriptional repressor